MLIDSHLTLSRWQFYVELLGCCVISALLWATAFPVLFKILLIIVFIAAQYGFKKALSSRKSIQQLWQIDSLHWALRYKSNQRIYQATLINIDYRTLVLSLTFLVGGHKRHLVIWRDQVDQTQWRYFAIIANLRRQTINIV